MVQEFSEYMYQKDNIDELARHILQVLLRLGNDNLMIHEKLEDIQKEIDELKIFV